MENKREGVKLEEQNVKAIKRFLCCGILVLQICNYVK